MKKVLVILVICLCFVVGCSEKETDATKFEKEYEALNGQVTSSGKDYLNIDLPSESPIVYSNYDEVIKVLTEGTGVIYLGYPECPWCRNAIPVLLDAANSEGVPKVYYLHLKDERGTMVLDENNKPVVEKEADEGYNKMLEILGPKLRDYTIKAADGTSVNTGIKRIYVPSFIFVKDGEVKTIHVATVASQTDPYTPLNDEQKEELKNIFITNMKDIYNCSKEGC